MPTWGKPVGLGAIRVRTFDMDFSILQKFQISGYYSRLSNFYKLNPSDDKWLIKSKFGRQR
ncbi:hypothetical protein ENHYD8BJ_50051 [Enhydrobacter sp. 8BJ]|nr:hypothetical protein ENHYD8BJ_50051 [Enhydrobacter sp. 8BJ]